MSKVTEAVIIGGGVMGTSILYNLVSRGMKGPVLLEQSTLGSGSTGRSSGIVRMHYSTEVCTRLSWESYKIFMNFDQLIGGNASFVKTGFMLFAPQEAVEGMEANIKIQQRVGVDSHIISPKEAKELAPGFEIEEGEAIGWEPESGHADPSGVAMAYASRSTDLGATICLQSQAKSVEVKNGRVVAVTTANDRYETPIAVVATGPWSDGFLTKLGVKLPIEATRHEVFLIRRPTDKLPSMPGGADMANLTYFRPEGSDLTLVGNGNVESAVNPDTYNQRSSMDYVQDVWLRASKRIPDLAEGEFYTGYAGLYTSTPDLHPIIDAVEGIDGLYVCTGFSGHGFKLSPTVGICMAELIIDGVSSTVDISPLRISRFSEGDLNHLSYDFKVIA